MTEKLYKKCACNWRAKCEGSLGACGEFATTSEWMPDYKTGRWNPVWLCDDHLGSWNNRPEKLKGIDRPDHADEYWKPSILEHARHGISALAFEDRRAAASQPVNSTPRFSWQQHWTPAMIQNYQRLIEATHKSARR